MTEAIVSPTDSRIATSNREDQVNHFKGAAFPEHRSATTPVVKSSSHSHGGSSTGLAATHQPPPAKETSSSAGKDQHHSSGVEKKRKEGDRPGDAERKREHDHQARQENGHGAKKLRVDDPGSKERKHGISSSGSAGAVTKADGAVRTPDGGDKKKEHHGGGSSGEHRKEHGGEKKKEHSSERKEHMGEKKEHSGEKKKEHSVGGEKTREHSSSSEKNREHSSGEKKKEHGSSGEKKKEHGSSGEKKREHGSSGEKKREHSSGEKRKEHGSGEKKGHASSSDKVREASGHKSSDPLKDRSKQSGLTNGTPSITSSSLSSDSPAVGSAAPGAAAGAAVVKKEPPAPGASSSSAPKPKDQHGGEAKPGKSTGGGGGLAGAAAPSSSAGKVIKQEISSPVKVSSSVLFSETVSETSMKVEAESDDDMPLAKRKETAAKNSTSHKVSSAETVTVKKRKLSESDDEDNVALANSTNNAKRVKMEAEVTRKITTKDTETKKKVVKKQHASDDEGDFKDKKRPSAAGTIVVKEKTKRELKKETEVKEVWRWWEEERRDDNVKWKFLEHKGPLFAPVYEPLPDSVQFKYDGKPYKLEPETEEVAGFYGRMIEHEYTTRDVFNKNFMKDWRQVMTPREREHITDLKKCDFRAINEYYKQKSEERKAMSKEEKTKIKEANEKIVQEYGFCKVDGHTEKIGNFRIEPPGLFRGRGDHPKQGMLKRRLMPEDIIINCSKDSKIPVPPPGHKWKEVRHDNEVTWLASWTENVQGQVKYVMLNASSKVKGEKDWMKYETARKLHKCIDRIRSNYQEDLRSKEMRIRQRAVALYFIDKLALRAGNEKDADEQADTVGCCSLRVEHVTLHDELDGNECVVEFDFPGKDSIRYQNKVPVEKRAYKNLKLFVENKQPGDLLFDRLNTTILNKHLQDLMEGLTAKVFRTYNASRTLEEQLEKMTDPNDTVAAKMLAYNRANRAVAILCNHQRAAPKNFDQQMLRMQDKIKEKQQQIKEAKRELKDSRDKSKDSPVYQKKKKQIERLEDQLAKLEVQATDKGENKEIALSTSKLNYLDPRISVAWCKRFDVPIEKVYNKTQRQKFMWALDMAEADFSFRT